jgi:hypothetical protein
MIRRERERERERIDDDDDDDEDDGGGGGSAGLGLKCCSLKKRQRETERGIAYQHGYGGASLLYTANAKVRNRIFVGFIEILFLFPQTKQNWFEFLQSLTSLLKERTQI